MRADKNVVELLQRWLALAEEGEIREVVLVGVFAGAGYETAYALHDTETMIVEMRAAAYQMQKDSERPSQCRTH